jgi:hypothetical protein
LKSWIQSHYAERLLTCWQSERSAVRADRPVGAIGRDPQCPALRRQFPAGVAHLEKREINHFRHEIKSISAPNPPIQDSGACLTRD